MQLGRAFPTSDFPTVYDSDSYDLQAARALKRAHIVIGEGTYTYSFEDGDRSSYWTSWSATTVTDFITKYHHSKLFGPFALYPLIKAQQQLGSYKDLAFKASLMNMKRKR
jgi:hypothetical protein